MNQEFLPVIPLSDMPADGVYCTRAAGVDIVLCRVKRDVYALSNACTHAQSAFDGGRLRGRKLICPLHGAVFDLRTGQPKGRLTQTPLATYPARITSDGMIEVSVVNARD